MIPIDLIDQKMAFDKDFELKVPSSKDPSFFKFYHYFMRK